MNLSRGRNTLSSCVAVAMLAGCGGSQPPIGAPGAVPQTARIATHADRGTSWMLPEAATDDLLYVSNLQNVKVYSYPAGKHVGTLRGFYRPHGECVDSAGDVFIANQDTIVEYKHGGKKSIRTLTFPRYSSIGCASDPTTGDLAVTWSTNSTGYVAIYQDASGTPTLYSNGDMKPYYCGYDNKGNLFVDGTPGEASGFMFAELPEGGSNLINVSLNQSISFGYSVQWDGKYIAVEDPTTSKIYRFAISSYTGTLKGTTSLGGLTIGPLLAWIIGDRVLVAYEAFVSYKPLGEVLYYKYPTGGSATKTILDGVGTAPEGVTVSLAPKK